MRFVKSKQGFQWSLNMSKQTSYSNGVSTTLNPTDFVTSVTMTVDQHAQNVLKGTLSNARNELLSTVEEG